MSTGPPVSKYGRFSNGNENAHFHHLAPSLPYCDGETMLGALVGSLRRAAARSPASAGLVVMPAVRASIVRRAMTLTRPWTLRVEMRDMAVSSRLTADR